MSAARFPSTLVSFPRGVAWVLGDRSALMSTKDRERLWMDIARAARPDLLRGELLSGESPDFVLTAGEESFGVEITSYAREISVGESAPEEQTGLRLKLLSLAKKAFAKRSATQLRVGCVFSGSPALHYTRLPAIAAEIVDYLFARLDGAAEWTHVHWSSEDEGIEVEPPAEITSVYARVVPSVGNMHWYPAQAGWVSYASKAEIERTVEQKERKLSLYRRRCDSILLMIVFDGMPHDSAAIHAPEEPVAFAIATGCDGVLCLDAREKRLVVIPVVPQLA